MEAAIIPLVKLEVLFGILCISGHLAIANSAAQTLKAQVAVDHSVNCSGRHLQAVPSGIPAWTQHLDLSFNNITSIQRSDFPLHSPHMTRLNISHNCLGEVGDGAFSGFPGVEELDLGSNTLGTVTEGMFRGLRGLRELDLRENHLTRIHPQAFSDLVSLQSLWLQSNSLTSVPEAVNGLARLTVLSLGTNLISQVDSRNFHGCQDLMTLHLEDNRMSRVSVEAFLELKNLKMLDLRSNQLGALPAPAIKSLSGRGIDLRLHDNGGRCDCGLGAPKGQGTAWLTDWVLCAGSVPLTSRRSLWGGRAPLRLSHTVTISIPPGRALTLPCRNGTGGGVVQYWQTPSRRLENRSSRDGHNPIETHCDGSLRISSITPRHSGLYYCLLEDSQGRAIISYRVKTANIGDDRTVKPRRTRDAQVYTENVVSDGHFAAAVTSSVLVTFLAAFTIGAFSRSPLIRCVGRARALVQHKRGECQDTSGGDNHQIATDAQVSPYENVVFRKHLESEEASVEITQTPAKAPHSFRGKHDDVPQGSACLEGCEPEPTEEQQENSSGRNREEDSGNSGAAHGGGGSEEEHVGQVAEEGQREGSGSEERVPPRPKRRSRVIKLYNYDEEGHQYGHIKDPGEESELAPQPKQRTRSLTRLSAIMNTSTASAAASDPTTDQEPAHSDAAEPDPSAKPTFQLAI